jgi:hypothetical protein
LRTPIRMSHPHPAGRAFGRPEFNIELGGPAYVPAPTYVPGYYAPPVVFYRRPVFGLVIVGLIVVIIIIIAASSSSSSGFKSKKHKSGYCGGSEGYCGGPEGYRSGCC